MLKKKNIHEIYGNLKIKIIEGIDLKQEDWIGKSDPYVIARIGRRIFKTKIVPKELNPKWDEQFRFLCYYPVNEDLDLKVWDWDRLKKDDFLGEATIDLSRLKINEVLDETITLTRISQGKVRVQVVFEPIKFNYNASM